MRLGIHGERDLLTSHTQLAIDGNRDLDGCASGMGLCQNRIHPNVRLLPSAWVAVVPESSGREVRLADIGGRRLSRALDVEPEDTRLCRWRRESELAERQGQRPESLPFQANADFRHLSIVPRSSSTTCRRSNSSASRSISNFGHALAHRMLKELADDICANTVRRLQEPKEVGSNTGRQGGQVDTWYRFHLLLASFEGLSRTPPGCVRFCRRPAQEHIPPGMAIRRAHSPRQASEVCAQVPGDARDSSPPPPRRHQDSS
jgi:hypothetical protein